jgi:hypothetical protein
MRRLLIHLAVALVAFVVGVKLAWAFGLLFGACSSAEEVRPVYAAPVVVSAPRCKTKAAPRVYMEAPPPPAPPAAPQPPKQTRVTVRSPDGTVRVIETQTPSGR